MLDFNGDDIAGHATKSNWESTIPPRRTRLLIQDQEIKEALVARSFIIWFANIESFIHSNYTNKR